MMMAQHHRSLFSEALLQTLHSVATGLMNKLEMPAHAAKRLYLAGRRAFPKSKRWRVRQVRRDHGGSCIFNRG